VHAVLRKAFRLLPLDGLGMSQAEFAAALAYVDPGGVIETGGLTEAEMKHRYATALGLPGSEAF
jgi:hypothetical protein